jgi:GNAT superfamily N-acetyltransferase
MKVLGRVYRKIRCAILLLRVGGLKVFLHQLRRQLYNRDAFTRLEKNLEDSIRTPCGVKYSLSLATKEDMQEVLQRVKTEGNNSARELVQRNWFYECGFHNCYIARVNDSGEICHLAWLVFPDEESIVEQDLKERLPALKREQCLLENAYTFTTYRGRGLMSSVIVQLSEMARSRGCKRMIAYVREDNLASLKACETAGFKKYDEEHELKLLFFTKVKRSGNNRGDVTCLETSS